jgi:molybdate transport system substrate-binding protein
MRQFIGVVWMLVASHLQAEEITVAVASNFMSAMRDIQSQFEQDEGHKVRLSFGSSGQLYAQIIHGAPFQIFFSADQEKAVALERDGVAVSGSRFTYATGRLALWSASSDMVDQEGAVLRRAKKIALANPLLAPYGGAAVEVLRNLGLEAATRSRWVQGENIAQVWQFVSSGNADVGFVALSQVMHSGHPGTGSTWIIPAHLHTPILQDAVLLRRGEDSLASRSLLRFVRSAKGLSILAANGYESTGAVEQEVEQEGSR